MEQIPFFIDKMRNIHGVEWDLLVTGGNIDEDGRRLLQDFKPDTAFLVTENVGYDVWPFICAVKSTDLSRYDFVIKIHTKNMDDKVSVRFNGRNFNGPLWRDVMVDALLGSPDNFAKVADAFKDETVGMVYSMDVNVRSRGTTIEDSSMLKNEMDRIGIKPRSMEYCAGTMFAVRAEALSYLQSAAIVSTMFPHSGESHSKGTMAHVYERILTIAVTAAGYRRVLIAGSLAARVRLSIRNLVQPALEWLFSINHYGDSYDKYLTLFGIRILIKKNG